MTSGEYIAGWLRSMVQQEFGAPVKQVHFTGVKLGGMLKMPNSFQWIAALLLDVAQQMEHISLVFRGFMFLLFRKSLCHLSCAF